MKVKRVIGVSLVVVGIMLIISGFVLIASVISAPVYFSPNLNDSFPPSIPPGSFHSRFPYALVGFVLVILGSIMLITGVLLLHVRPKKE